MLKILKHSCFRGIVALCVLIGVFCAPHLNAQSIGEEKLKVLHTKLHLIHGNFGEEYPEQLMAATFISKNAKVLELGGNVGRNSCIIASLLTNSKNLIVVEPGVGYAEQLLENRDANGLKFRIEVAAVSKVSLIQAGWKTIPGEEVLPGFSDVTTISFNKLQKKHKIKFDTLVVDCEGALYQILVDDPNVLRNINLVIIENDFDKIEEMFFVQEVFKKSGLKCVFNQAGGWGPCVDSFYQVWKK